MSGQQGSKLDQAVASIPETGKREYAAEILVRVGTSAVFRIVDGPDSFLEFQQSWFMCDDDTIKPFVVENEKEGKGVLARLLGDVRNWGTGGYLESKKGQFGKVYVHQAKDPELFKRITEYWNPSYNGSGSAKQSIQFVYNAIHRNPETIDGQQLNWCNLNKHTKLIKFGQTALTLLKAVIANDGDVGDYDIVFGKQGDKKSSMLRAGKNVPNIVIGPLSEEEEKYTRYDLEYETRLASAFYILKNLKVTIGRIDKVMGTAYLAELETQAEIEKNSYESRKAGNEQAPVQNVPGVIASSPFDDSAVPMDDPFAARTPVTPVAAVTSISRIPSGVVMTKCGYCNTDVQAGVAVCTACNKKLLMECDICHKPFSTLSDACPYCGTRYKQATG